MNATDLNRAIASWTERYAQHILLELTPPASPVRAFHMKIEGQHIDSTLILTTPEGVVIMGDLVPGGERALVSIHATGLDWFLMTHNPEYLSQKFLTKEWIREDAIVELEGLLRDVRGDTVHGDGRDDDDCVLAFLLLIDKLRANDGDQNDVIDVLNRYDFDEAHEFGMGYAPEKVGHLAALQRRFTDLFVEGPFMMGPHD